MAYNLQIKSILKRLARMMTKSCQDKKLKI
jgi:hypothetical protein